MKYILYIAYVPAIIWMYIIAGFSGASGESSSSLSLRVTEWIVDIIDVGDHMTGEEFTDTVELLHTPVRKAAHMTEYAILFIWVFIPLRLTAKKIDFKRSLLIVLIVCIIYASFDEVHQLFVDGRSGKITDVLIDSIGALIGLITVLCVNKLAHCKIIRKSKQ